MAAAVADYTPSGGAAGAKIAKTDGPLTLTLERTPDILAELGRDARRRRPAGARSDSPPRPAIPSRAAATKLAAASTST